MGRDVCCHIPEALTSSHARKSPRWSVGISGMSPPGFGKADVPYGCPDFGLAYDPRRVAGARRPLFPILTAERPLR